MRNKDERLPRMGPDDRPGYQTVSVLDGYNLWAPSYDQTPNPLIALEEPIVLELVGAVQDLQVLDMGCGTGRYCVHLAARGAQVIGVDMALAMLQHAHRKRPQPHFHLLASELTALGVRDGCCDLIVCALTLNHLVQWAGVFAELTRVLRPGGRLILSDFHPYWVVFGHDYTEFMDEQGQEYRLPCYPHLFVEWWELCHRYGFVVEEWREPRIEAELVAQFPSLHPYQGLPLAWIVKLVYQGSAAV